MQCLAQAQGIWSMIKKWISIDDKQYMNKIFMEKDNPILFMEIVMEISYYCEIMNNVNKIYRTFTFNINGSDSITREIYAMPGPGLQGSDSFVKIIYNSVEIFVFPITQENFHVIGFRFMCETEKQIELDNFLIPIMMKHNIRSKDNRTDNQIINNNQQMND